MFHGVMGIEGRYSWLYQGSSYYRIVNLRCNGDETQEPEKVQTWDVFARNIQFLGKSEYHKIKICCYVKQSLSDIIK